MADTSPSSFNVIFKTEGKFSKNVKPEAVRWNTADHTIEYLNGQTNKWEVAAGKGGSDIEIDATPTANSTNAVSSGGTYTALAEKAPKEHVSLTADGAVYGMGKDSQYGHVRLSDATGSTLGQTSGVAASPKAVKAAYDKGVEALNAANSAITTANSAVKTVNSELPDSDGNVIVDNNLPIGTVVYYANGTKIPYGFLKCDGSEVSRTTYSALFEVVGTTYGTPSSDTVFKLPNLMDKFIEGGLAAGTEKEAGLPNITDSLQFRTLNSTAVSKNIVDTYPESNSYHTGSFYFEFNSGSTWGSAINKSDGIGNKCDVLHFDASRSSDTYGNSTTVQPPALVLVPYIKAYNAVQEQTDPAIPGTGVPVGTVTWNASKAAPAGYLLCDGAAVSRTTYPDLFASIGTAYGAGDGSTTFNLPDLMNKFIEGGLAENAGTEKEAGLPNITGEISGLITGGGGSLTFAGGTGDWMTMGGTGAFGSRATNSTQDNYFSASQYSHNTNKTSVGTFSAAKSNSIYGNSTTVQPPALVLCPYIKAFDAVINQSAINVATLAAKIDMLDAARKNMIGSTAYFHQGAAPEGWVACSRQLISFADYPEFKAKWDTGAFASNTLENSSTAATIAANPGKFVKNADNTGVYLPDTCGYIIQATDSSHAIGTLTSAGLPNVTGYASYINSDGINNTKYPDTGALFWNDYSHSRVYTLSTGTGKRDLRINASKSNSLYGSSTTVQPATTRLTLAVYLGNASII